MHILVIGGGGREHALGWKLSQSPQAEKIYFSPGNGGTSDIGENIALDLGNHPSVADWVCGNNIGLVVIGPDEYLAQGLVDGLQETVKVFGPTQAAAEIEWSKSFAKQLMLEERIPTARFETFSDIESAQKYVGTQVFPLVIKADGLASGKGVVIARSLEEASAALESMMRDKAYGTAGEKIVVEEFLIGREISVHAFCDGETALLFPSSQDHKRAFDGDTGPNTGGMGTIAPVPGVTEAELEEIKEKVILPALRGLKKRGRPFSGVLYPGVMLTADGPKVIEFNARFGDPETQSYMRLLKTDLVEILLACIDGTLSKIRVEWESASACCIVLASGGYPEKYETGVLVEGMNTVNERDAVIFHAGTRRQGKEIVTAGGRVLGVTAVDDTLAGALQKAYAVIPQIHFEGMRFRKDIGQKAA